MRRIKPPPAASVTSLLRPAWLVTHVVLLGAAVAMVFLGRWQLHVSESNHWDPQTTSYIVQWWAFALCTVLFWGKLVRDARRPPPAAASPSGEVVLRAPSQALARSGPANLVQAGGDVPVVYRGYVLPDSATTPHRSYGDDLHNEYNDYLWQISLGDEPEEPRPADGR
ncbi:hypothetical protein [uncultured Jatrophihabitans sp.]|uniref:hypothetical protein n=1 Tax=uncultured Jatrophihabitans sp. TaxID=1610747 RepID=UPI0035C99CB3